MCIPCRNTFLFGAKVKIFCQDQGQGHLSRSHLKEMVYTGALVFHKHTAFFTHDTQTINDLLIMLECISRRALAKGGFSGL